MKSKSLNMVGMALVLAIAVGATWVWAQDGGTPILRVSTWHSVILGDDWTAGATVTLTINDPTTGPGVDYTDSFVVPSDGEVVFDMRASFQLQPGQIVKLSDGPTTRELTITSLQVTSVDPDADTISGTADPGAEVSVEVEQEDELTYRYLTADQAGNWTADFSEPGGEPGQEVLDIACTQQSSCCWVEWSVERFDEDGDSTEVWFGYGPEFQVRLPSAVWGNAWMVDSTVTLAIDDDNDPGNGVLYTASQTTEPSPWGMWFDQHANWAFFGGTVDIQTGYVVRMNDDYCYTEHTVKNLTVTNIDLEADTVAGLADPNVSLRLHIYTEPTAKRWVEADEFGHWAADFSDPTGGDTHDINLETAGLVNQEDEDDGNSTVVSWDGSSFIVSSVSQCIGDVQDLVDEGTLKPGQANGLIRPLENAIRSLEKGKTNSACSQLQDFVDEVNDKIGDGVLSLEEGQALIDAANNIRDALGGDYARAEPGQEVNMVLLPKFLGHPVFDQAHNGADEAHLELQNPGELQFLGPTPENAIAGQIEIVTTATTQGMDAIMISNAGVDQIAPAAVAARDAGMTVVTWDSPIPSAEGEQVFVAQVDFDETGKLMADMALSILGEDGGKFAVLSASPDAANQNAWIAALQEVLETDAMYANLELLDIVYGNDQSEDSYNQALALVDKYPDMELIMAPTTIGIVAAAKAMQDEGLCDEVKVSGLGLPAEMVSYTLNGCAPEFALWSFVDLGYLTYYTTYLLATDAIEGKVGDRFEAGRMGTYTIEIDPTRDAGLRVLMGPFIIYTKDNIEDTAK